MLEEYGGYLVLLLSFFLSFFFFKMEMKRRCMIQCFFGEEWHGWIEKIWWLVL